MNVWLRRFSRTFLIWTCVATPSAGSLFRKYVSHQGGTGFYKLLLWLGERAGKVALDVEFTNEFVHYEDGDNDLTLHQGRSGKITWIFCNIMHHNGLPACGCGPAESGVEGNASVGREAARERPDQQDAGVRRIDEIKPYPVITSHLFVQTLRDMRHDGLGRRSGSDKTLKFLQKFFVHRHSVFGPPGGEDQKRLRCCARSPRCHISVRGLLLPSLWHIRDSFFFRGVCRKFHIGTRLFRKQPGVTIANRNPGSAAIISKQLRS